MQVLGNAPRRSNSNLQLMQPQTGDIVVVLNGTWTLAKAIQRVTRSKAHHTGIIVIMNDNYYVSEMDSDQNSDPPRTGHLFTRWDDTKYNNGKPTDRTIILMRSKQPIDWSKLPDWCLSNTAEYDFLALLQHVIARYTGLWIGRRNAKAARRFTCSEWVAYTLNRFAGLFPQWWKVSPADIAALDGFELIVC